MRVQGTLLYSVVDTVTADPREANDGVKNTNVFSDYHGQEHGSDSSSTTVYSTHCHWTATPVTDTLTGTVPVTALSVSEAATQLQTPHVTLGWSRSSFRKGGAIRTRGEHSVRKEPVRRRAYASTTGACRSGALTARRWSRRRAAAVVGASLVMLLTVERRQTRTHVVASHSTSLAPYLASTLAHSSSTVQRLPPTLTPLTLVGGPPTTLATRSSTFARFSGACVA